MDMKLDSHTAKVAAVAVGAGLLGYIFFGRPKTANAATLPPKSGGASPALIPAPSGGGGSFGSLGGADLSQGIPPASGQFYVNTKTDPLNLRDSPEGSVVGSLPKGAVVNYQSGPQTANDSSVWYEVSYGGMSGWASAAYLVPVAPSAAAGGSGGVAASDQGASAGGAIGGGQSGGGGSLADALVALYPYLNPGGSLLTA